MELLSCPLCLKPHFQGVDELRSSLITVATSQISCPVCNEILMGLDKLTIHLFSHITHNLVQEGLNKSAPVISEPHHFQREELPNKIKENVPINSGTKTKIIEKYNNLIEESILTIPKANPVKKTMRCDICNFYFSDENILDMHQKLLHQTQVDSKTGQSSYHCHLCSKKFKMRGSLMVHLRVAHYGFVNQDSEGCTNKSSIHNNDLSKATEKADKSNDGKQWVCDECSKQFTTKYFLKKHKRLHTGEMPYFCAQCNKSFTFQQSYHKHMLYHSSEKPHLCSECGRAFKELSTLHNHERIHSGERPFVCETCGKSFRQRVSYLVHRRIHTGAMPYKCTACDKSFRYKISQKSHKCSANPPGSVVRAPVLVEKLMQKTFGKKSEVPADSNVTKISDIDINQVPQRQTYGFHDKIQTSVEGTIVKNNTNMNFLTSSSGLSLSNGVKAGNHVNTIIFNSEGQIIGQNFAFDGQSIVAITPKLVKNDCTSTISAPVENSDASPKKDLFEKYVPTDAAVDTQAVSEVNKDHTATYEYSDNKNPDFLSMVLSPIIPDVQSLCLSGSPTNDNNEDCCLKQEPLETINEESFKSLLDGLSNCL